MADISNQVKTLIGKNTSGLSTAEKNTIAYCVLFLVAVAAIDTYFLVVYRKNHERHREKDEIPVPSPQSTKHPPTTNYSWKIGQQCFQLTNLQGNLTVGNCVPGHTWIYNDQEDIIIYRDSTNHRCIEAYNSSNNAPNRVLSVTEDNADKCKGVQIVKDANGNTIIVSNGGYISLDPDHGEVWTDDKSNEQSYILEPF